MTFGFTLRFVPVTGRNRNAIPAGTSRNEETPTGFLQVRVSSAISTLRRGGGIRTHDLFVPNEARYQAAPHPVCSLR